MSNEVSSEAETDYSGGLSISVLTWDIYQTKVAVEQQIIVAENIASLNIAGSLVEDR